MQTLFKALNSDIRIKIINELLKKERCICELTENYQKDQSVIFRHIKVLEEAKLISTKKADKFLMCRINPKAKKEIGETMNFFKKIINKIFKKMEEKSKCECCYKDKKAKKK